MARPAGWGGGPGGQGRRLPPGGRGGGGGEDGGAPVRSRHRPLRRGGGGRPEDGARMKPLKIDHLGIAVPSLAEAVAAFEALGFRVEETHEGEAGKGRGALLPVGGR